MELRMDEHRLAQLAQLREQERQIAKERQELEQEVQKVALTRIATIRTEISTLLEEVKTLSNKTGLNFSRSQFWNSLNEETPDYDDYWNSSYC